MSETSHTGIQLSRAQRWLLFASGWTLLGLFQAARLYYLYNVGGSGSITFPHVLSLALSDWYIWGALSPLIYHLAKRLDIDRGQWGKRLATHVGLAFVFSAVHLFVFSLFVYLMREHAGLPIATTVESFGAVYTSTLASKLYLAVLTYLMIAFVSYAIGYYQRFREKEHRLAQAESRLSEARLKALRGQLQPHFLFNALNAITALIHTNPESADRMISRLSDLLRMSLERENEQFCTLARELEFIERYLAIQKMRFEDKLQIKLDVSAEALEARVPSLILQPLVENAVKHGIAAKTKPGLVYIGARQTNGHLEMSVADDGPGLSPDWHSGTGRGLRNTRERLAALYGKAGDMQVENGVAGGVTITVKLPADPTER